MSAVLMRKYVEIGLVIALYWIVSILTVFINKSLLSGTNQLDAPFFIVWFQCFISALICFGAKTISGVVPWLSFPSGSPFNRTTIRKVAPISVLFTSMILFNTLCLKYTGVAFYYIGRSLTTVFNVVLTNWILNETVSRRAFLCCAVIVFGFFIGIDQESVAGSLSVVGTLSGVMGSLSLALYSMYTKKALPAVGGHIWLLSYFNNVYSCMFLAPFILLTGEAALILDSPQQTDSAFWALMVVGGLCGFSIGYVTSLQIKTTSPLTHNISGTAKACAQTVIATSYYSESKTALWWISNFVVLAGSAAYSAVKQKELRDKYSSIPRISENVNKPLVTPK